MEMRRNSISSDEEVTGNVTQVEEGVSSDSIVERALAAGNHRREENAEKQNSSEKQKTDRRKRKDQSVIEVGESLNNTSQKQRLQNSQILRWRIGLIGCCLIRSLTQCQGQL